MVSHPTMVLLGVISVMTGSGPYVKVNPVCFSGIFVLFQEIITGRLSFSKDSSSNGSVRQITSVCFLKEIQSAIINTTPKNLVSSYH